MSIGKFFKRPIMSLSRSLTVGLVVLIGLLCASLILTSWLWLQSQPREIFNLVEPTVWVPDTARAGTEVCAVTNFGITAAEPVPAFIVVQLHKLDEGAIEDIFSATTLLTPRAAERTEMCRTLPSTVTPGKWVMTYRIVFDTYYPTIPVFETTGVLTVLP
jgi:hypothetical protein